MLRPGILGSAVLVMAGLALAQEDAAPATSPTPNAAVQVAAGKFPLYFVENRGVYPEAVHYYVQGADKTLFFTPGGITFRFQGDDDAWVVKLDFVGADPGVVPRGEDGQGTIFSYFRGPRKEWKVGLPAFSKVVYSELWPGIDLVYSGTVNRLKYSFLVQPGASPEQVQLRYRGAPQVEVTERGALRVTTPSGSFEDAPPIAWQEIEGRRVPVEMAYRVTRDAAGAAIGFELGDYDPAHPLLLDPAVLVYCGFVGGSSSDFARGIAVDAAGNAYITGQVGSTETTFPVAVGPDLTHNGSYDAVVAKVNAAGTGLVYCGYIGGSSIEVGYGIAVDGAGSAYVTGYTRSTEQTFPVTVGPDLTHNGGGNDVFVAKVNAAGTSLVYCGYIGGSGAEYTEHQAIAVDTAGNAYLTGRTASTETTFPVVVGPDLTHNGGGNDAFVAKVNAAGTALVYCGYIGGSGNDLAYPIALDSAGNAYIAGSTVSSEATFPVAVGPDLTFNGGTYDAFVAKVNATGTALVYCGYIGGSTRDEGFGLGVDASGNAYVTGLTDSTEATFPVAVGPDLTHNGGNDVFVAKVNAAGKALLSCGYIGGMNSDFPYGLAVDAAGNTYVTGSTASDEKTFPVAVGPDLTYNGGSFDAFVAKVNSASTGLVYCGYIGGSSGDYGEGLAVNTQGNAYVVGYAQSDEQTFPVATGPDLTHNGGYDGFVAKLTETFLAASGLPVPGGVVALSLSSFADAGLPYQLGSSFGNGPIPIDNRRLELSPDPLLILSVAGAAPGVFQNYAGVLDSQGRAAAKLAIPNIPVLKGLRIYTAFVTLKASAPSSVSSISNTFLFTIQ